MTLSILRALLFTGTTMPVSKKALKSTTQFENTGSGGLRMNSKTWAEAGIEEVEVHPVVVADHAVAEAIRGDRELHGHAERTADGRVDRYASRVDDAPRRRCARGNRSRPPTGSDA